jgi:UDP-glucuronate 4-epimerase
MGTNVRRRAVLVTGGAGFIGSHVAERMLETGRYEVTILDNFNSFYDPALKRENGRAVLRRDGARLVAADILDVRAMPELFASSRFDVVIHLAARAGVRPSLADPLLYQRVNVEGTYRLLELARAYGVRQFVFASSSSVYGARSKVPFSESDAVDRPVSPYAATKLAGEAACHAYAHLFGIRTLCLRFFTAYGPRQRPDLAIRKFADLMCAGRPVPVFGDGRTARDYTYVDDVAECVVRAAEYTASDYEVINVGGERPVRLGDLVSMLGDALGVTPRIERLAEQAGDVPLTSADGAKARRLLGFEPRVPFEDGIRRFAEWYRRTASTARVA